MACALKKYWTKRRFDEKIKRDIESNCHRY